MRTKGLIVTVCGLLLVAAACGGGGSAQPVRLVEKSFVLTQGDAVCKALVADVSTLVGQFKAAHPTPSPADAHDFLVTSLLPRIDRGVGDLHRLGEPTKDRVGFDNAVLALDKDLTALKLAVSADPIKVVNNPVALFATSTKLFTDYGFKECGKA